MRVVNAEHPELERLGLPRGNDFVTREGEMAINRGGKLHVWSWVPVAEDSADAGAGVFAGTGLEETCRTVHDVEYLIHQVILSNTQTEAGIDQPLKRALQK
jgi:hypothetical protein